MLGAPALRHTKRLVGTGPRGAYQLGNLYAAVEIKPWSVAPEVVEVLRLQVSVVRVLLGAGGLVER